MTRIPCRAAAALLAAVLLGGAASCGGDDDTTSGDRPTGGTSTSSATSPGDPTSGATSESTDASTSPSTSPAAPTVTPASGIALTEASSTVRAPAGWVKQPDLVEFASGASEPGKLNTMQLVDSGDISGGGSLDQQAASAIAVLPKGTKAVRLPDVSLDGSPAFHIHYVEPGDSQEYDTVTTIRNGRNVGLDFVLSKKSSATNPELIASVLATFQWIA